MKSMVYHENVIQLYGICVSPLAIVTEYLEKGSLWTFLKSKENLLPNVRHRIIVGIAKGMYHLHKCGIIHRDLATRNVLLASDMNPKIADFGFSRITEKDENKTKSNEGPLRSMAPECINNKIYGVKTDVWSFGVTLIEIFTRNIPFPQMGALQVAVAISNGQMTPPIPNNVPTGIADIMAKCFEYNPATRPDFKGILEKLHVKIT